MRIAVLGAGYVGLVTGACLADIGHEVHLIDTDEEKISKLNDGEIPIYEPGLEEIIGRGCISFHHVLEASECQYDVFYIAVGTPEAEDGSADISQVLSAARFIGNERVPGKHQVIVIKSTVPPGTSDAVRAAVEPGFQVVSNPEFLKEGNAIADFKNPDRVVIGIREDETQRSAYPSPHLLMLDIYKDSGIGPGKFIFMDNVSAELCKYANNGMLATRISFMNEVSRIANDVGASIDDVRRGVGSDRRIGESFLNAGPGWGGSCFPKDVSALARMGSDTELLPLINSAISTNHIQKRYIVDRALSLLNRTTYGDNCACGFKICILGVAFKPGTDDTRDSPSLDIMRYLSSLGAEVVCHDPVAKLEESFCAEYGVEQIHGIYDAVIGCDLVVLVTDWRDYVIADWGRISDSMEEPCVLDTRNVLAPLSMPDSMRLSRL